MSCTREGRSHPGVCSARFASVIRAFPLLSTLPRSQLSMTPLQESERRKTDINEKNGKVRSIARRSGTSGTSASTSDPSHRSRHLRARGLAEVDGKPMVTRSYRKLQLADCYTNVRECFFAADSISGIPNVNCFIYGYRFHRRNAQTKNIDCRPP